MSTSSDQGSGNRLAPLPLPTPVTEMVADLLSPTTTRFPTAVTEAPEASHDNILINLCVVGVFYTLVLY